jgi:RNA polymerase sigma-70 factor, ECF subfamily
MNEIDTWSDPCPAGPAGFPAGIEKAFEENHAMVFRAAYRVTRDAADAEDAVQTVFLRLLRRGPGADFVENVSAFLHCAALNAARDVTRRRRRAMNQVSLDHAGLEPPAPPHTGPERAHAAAEVAAWLRRAVARLDSRSAEIFTLRFFEGKENREIARMLETTPGTVAVTLCRAKGRLHREYRAWQLGEAC